MAEEVGFEPTVGGHPTTVFKTAALNHSATPPQGKINYKDTLILCQEAFEKKINVSF